ncbi:MAG: CarD family transcriptional regulator [Halobacteriovoraceae bacterium]|nr:CarD family transcriptional regulator [Halobacteriovoraceae bacterium]
MFKIGEYAVCPGHGVGQIIEIKEQQVGKENKLFYIVKILTNGMTVMVPTDSENGIRELVPPNEINDVYQLLKNHQVELDLSTWNRRYRDYMAKIKTGSLLEIADVLRTLFLLKETKGLSFGEKKMLEQCRDLLIQEIALSGGEKKTDIQERINSCFPV